MTKNNIFPQLLLILVALIWGSGFIAASIALRYEIKPFTMMTIRFGIASFIMVLFFGKRIVQNSKDVTKIGMISGLFLFSAFAFQTFGLQFTTASKNAFLTSLNVIIVPIIFSFIYKSKPKKKVVIAALMSFIGVAMLTTNIDGVINFGDVLSIICAILFAAHIFSIDYYCRGKEIDTISFVFMQFIVSAILSGIMMLFFEDMALRNIASDGLLAVIYLGIFSTLFAFFIQNYAQKFLDSNRTSVILANEAVFATLLAVLILKETLTTNMLIGAMLLFSAILLSEVKVAKKVTKFE